MITKDNGYAVLTYDAAGFAGAVMPQPELRREQRDWQAVLDGFLAVAVKANPATDVTGVYGLAYSPGDGAIVTRLSTVGDELLIPTAIFGLLRILPPSGDFDDIAAVLVVDESAVSDNSGPVMLGSKVSPFGEVLPSSSLTSEDRAAMSALAHLMLMQLDTSQK